MRRWNLCTGLLFAGVFACAPVDTGSASVGPGSDAGPIFTGGGGTGADAGSGSGPDAGVTGGGSDAGASADAGSIDAGSGGGQTPDAGSTPDAGTAGGGASNGCDGILPASVPPPSEAIIPHKSGQACFYFTVDQKGDVAGADPGDTLVNTQWQLYSPTGAPAGSLSAGADLYGEPDGFEGASRDATSTSIVKWASSGFETNRVLLAGANCTGKAFLSVFNGVLGLGGCDGGVLTGVLFDAQGNAGVSRTLVPVKVDAVGMVDALGRTVVAVPGNAVGIASAYAARWFDGALSPLTDWFSLPGAGAHPALQPLIGGGAAYQVGDAWVATLTSGTAGTTDPPAFLAGHPKNDFRVIRNSRGYARIAKYGASEPRNKVELFDAAFDHCGTGTFPGEGLAIGHDGTVLASGGDGGCSLSWWSGLLR
jgi:hypothetical protein